MNKYGYQTVWQIEDREMFTSYEDLLAWLLDNASEVFGHSRQGYEYEIVTEDASTNGHLGWDVYVKVTDTNEEDEEFRYSEEFVTVNVYSDRLVTKRY